MKLFPLLFGGIMSFASTVLAAPDSLGRRHSNPRDSRADTEVSVRNLLHEQKSGWAGAVLTSTQPDSFVFINTTFTIPHLSAPPLSAPTKHNNTRIVTAWAGIDGYLLKTALLKAGVELKVTTWKGKNHVKVKAFYQWFPSAAVFVHDFHIKEGETIAVVVKALDHKSGWISLENLTTKKSKVFDVKAPKDSVLHGQNAEWIVEADTKHRNQLPLPDFGTFTFTLSDASEGTLNAFSLDGVELLNIKDEKGNLLTKSSVLDSQTIQVEYLASN